MDYERAVSQELAATWSTLPEALRLCVRARYLRRTVGVALVVGTILFVINQLDVVLRGHATPGVVLKVALTYLVPFCVSTTACWWQHVEQDHQGVEATPSGPEPTAD
jgi:hypothetical protein